MSEHTRRTKRFNREHRKRSKFSKAVDFIQKVLVRATTAQPTDGVWQFHAVEWGDLTVSVMPKSHPDGIVRDSNTGVVMKAPFHQSLRGHIVVSNGRRPDCDDRALNQVIHGDPARHWRNRSPEHSDRRTVYAIPKHRPPEERNEAWQMAVDAMVKGQNMSREYAEAMADQILGWAPYSLQCTDCQLEIPGISEQDVAAQAREYGWVFAYDDGQTPRPICPTCAEDYKSTPPAFKIRPIPSDDELAQKMDHG
jgi:hypothetical protein